MKRISNLIVASAKDLAKSKRFNSRALVLNAATGELRQGPGTWAEMKPWADGTNADISVKTVATANVTIASALNNADTLNGATLATGDVVLLTAQTAPEENGLYVVGVTPARHASYDTFAEHAGTLVKVTGGTDAGDLYLCTNSQAGTLGTTAITFVRKTKGGFVAPDTAVLGTDRISVKKADGTDRVVTAAILKTYLTS